MACQYLILAPSKIRAVLTTTDWGAVSQAEIRKHLPTLVPFVRAVFDVKQFVSVLRERDVSLSPELRICVRHRIDALI